MTNSKTTDKKEAEKPGAKARAKPEAKPTAEKVKPKAKPHAPSSSSAAAKEPAAKTTAKAPEAEKPKATQKSGGKGFLWFLIFVIVIAGSVTAGWPYIGPKVNEKVRPIVDDMRARLGLDPRPSVAPAVQVETIVEPEIVQTPEPAPQPEPVVEAAPEPMPELEQAPALAQDSAPVMVEDLQVPDVTGLTSRLNNLESELGSLSNTDAEAALAATQDLAHSISALKSELQALNNRLDSMDATLKDLGSRQSKQSGASVTAQALVLAATQLRVRLMGDGAFGAELAALERIGAGDAKVLAAVSRLKPHAEAGVPSEADLTARFTSVAADIVRAGAVSGEPGWMGTVKDSLSGLVTVRRTDPSQITNELDRALAVAEAALQIGALEEAVQALSELQGPPGEAAAAWLGDARARVDAEAALETLYNQALEAMAQVGGA